MKKSLIALCLSLSLLNSTALAEGGFWDFQHKLNNAPLEKRFLMALGLFAGLNAIKSTSKELKFVVALFSSYAFGALPTFLLTSNDDVFQGGFWAGVTLRIATDVCSSSKKS